MNEWRIGDRAVTGLYDALLDPASYTFSALSLWHFGAALIALVMGGLVLYWERGSRVSRHFAAFAALFTLWAAGRGLLRLIESPDLALFVSRRLYVLIMLAVALLYQFALITLRSEARRRRVLRLNWIIGAVLAVASVSTGVIIADLHRYSWGLEPIFGVGGYLSMLWVSALMLLAAMDAARAWLRSRPQTVERWRIGLFCAALGIVYFAYVDFLPAMGFAVYPAAFVPVCLFTLITGYITLHYGLVEVTPQLAAQQIASLVPGALLILDSDGVIQFVNHKAESMLGTRRDQLLGQTAGRIMSDAFEPAQLALQARMEGREAEREFMHQGIGDRPVRDLSLSCVAVRDRHQRDVAFVCLLRDITDQKNVQQQKQAQGLRDSLTGLPGRAMFMELLDTAVRRAQESKEYDFAVCFVGLDRLSVINEDLGYSIGDEVLAEFARRLRMTARAQDVVARIGGDEFGILLESAGPHEVPAFTQQLHEAIHAPLRVSDHDLRLSASIGVAESTWAYGSGAEILRDAGIAMYRVKQKGGSASHIVTRSERGTHRTRLEADMRKALETSQFRVHYQPILDLAERRVAGFEALVRWQHPERGLVLPGTFIELAEEIGLSDPIDTYVLQHACADLARLHQAVRDPRLTMSVNMAEGCLRQPQFAEEIGATLARHGLEPSSLRIEILERTAMVGPLRETLSKLRGLGVGLAVDDFGTGYSSLSRLHELPLTVLKVDRDFVRAMSQDPGGEKIIVAIVSLARSLGLTVVAEGASQAREARRLRDLGCRYIQGFYFAQAVSLEEAIAMVKNPAKYFGEKFSQLEATWLAPAPTEPRRVAAPRPGPRSRFARWFGLH